MEGLEPSQQKLLEPKPSASTIPPHPLFIKIIFTLANKSLNSF